MTLLSVELLSCHAVQVTFHHGLCASFFMSEFFSDMSDDNRMASVSEILTLPVTHNLHSSRARMQPWLRRSSACLSLRRIPGGALARSCSRKAWHSFRPSSSTADRAWRMHHKRSASCIRSPTLSTTSNFDYNQIGLDSPALPRHTYHSLHIK